MSVHDIVKRCEGLFEDLEFNAVKQWKAAHPGARAIGYLPIYVPREIIHAAGMLPVGIFGGGDQIEVIQGDAYYQSYICRIPRSTLELGLTGKLDCLDGMLFPVDLRRHPQPLGHVADHVQGQVRQVLRPAAELR
jgi:benzoyl-CoA reductase subunit C